MSDFQTLTYDVCRSYVQDQQRVFPEQTYKQILGWIRSRQLKKLASCSDYFCPPAYSCGQADLLRVLLQVEAFFKKNDVFAERGVCETAAASAFEKAERICRITNRRLDHYCVQRDRLDPDLNLYLTEASRYINRTLGDHRTFLDSLPRLVRVTSGATSTRSRRESTPFLKISKKPVSTPRAFPYINALSQYFGYGSIKENLTLSNRVEVVPKNWKTDRTIACEPEGNLPLQLAFDGYVKDRLRKRGIDLSDQSQNQRYAYEGSVSGKYATIDLSMASDTLAYNTVVELLPYEWFKYLEDVRSPRASGKFGNFQYAKFSSMGNGATFGLETLIFASACYAVGARDFLVYGDDIVIETRFVEPLLRFLRFLGFKVNTEKSFSQGPFRESCGEHWCEGKRVTPFYLRTWSKSKLDLCHNINGLAGISLPYGRCWNLLSSIIDEWKLKPAPYSLDTMTGIHVDASTSHALKIVKNRKGWKLQYKAYIRKERSDFNRDSRSLFLWHLQRYYKGKPDVAESLRAPRPVRTTGQLPRSLLKSIAARQVGSRSLPTSRNTISSHRYVRKWVHWIPPMAGTPLHVYTWSEFLMHQVSTWS